MIKNKLDFKLLNIAIFVFIVFLMYQTNGLWGNVFNCIFKIGFPFLIAFAIGYALYPYTKKLQSFKVPKALSILIIVFAIIGLFIFMILNIIPLLFEQLGSLFNLIIEFISEIQMKYDIDFGPLTDTLTTSFDKTLSQIGAILSNGIMPLISNSFSFLSTAIITISASIYFLLDMDKFRAGIKKHFKRKGKKTYNYILALDKSMKNYLEGFVRIMLITLVEYFILYKLIGHPNAMLLAFLAVMANLIPYFGGLITNVIALITAFVVSPQLFVKTLIVFAITSLLDSYIINPFVYGKSNEMHPLLVILSVFAGGILFGVVGIIISLPLTILLLTTYNYYKKDVKEMIEELKEAN